MTNANTPEARANEEALERASVDAWNAAIEAAAKYHDDIFEHDSNGIHYSSLVGIPISNMSELEASCRKAEMDAAAIRALKRPTDSEDGCRKCGAELVPGKALAQTLVPGDLDFPDDDHAVTYSIGGPGEMIDCLKCPECGWSMTTDSEGE